MPEITNVSVPITPPTLNRNQTPAAAATTENASVAVSEVPEAVEAPVPETRPNAPPQPDPSSGFPIPGNIREPIEPPSIVRQELLAGVFNEGAPLAKGTIISVKV